MNASFRTRLHRCLMLITMNFGFWAVCLAQQPFAMKSVVNPWIDDYREYADMQYYKSWGTYNVHDPSCLLVGDTYYMFSTDAIWREDSASIKRNNLPFGYIQVRTSKDLVNWNFKGWVFDRIPNEARQWVLNESGGVGASNVWAPYIFRHKDIFRLYFCVSAFGKQTSYIGLAEANSPAGPWSFRGCVVKTRKGDPMNAIDPSIVTDPRTGEQWMHYGSYFGGLYAVKLNPDTGLPLRDSDLGILTARRFDGKKNNIEAPEIIYNPDLKCYFLFVSYDPLMTTYNLRVGRSDKPEGPFTDFFGKDMRLEEDNLPILIYPYRFDNHPGWAGTGHCSVFAGHDGNFYLAHQGRLSPDNHQMVLHVRRIFWTEEGWPVLSPQRYAATPDVDVKQSDLIGTWEIISIQGKVPDRGLEAGQILWGENLLRQGEVNLPGEIVIHPDNSFSGDIHGKWYWNEGVMSLIYSNQTTKLQIHPGQDWENGMQTLLFTGIDGEGHSLWGKKIK